MSGLLLHSLFQQVAQCAIPAEPDPSSRSLAKQHVHSSAASIAIVVRSSWASSASEAPLRLAPPVGLNALCDVGRADVTADHSTDPEIDDRPKERWSREFGPAAKL